MNFRQIVSVFNENSLKRDVPEHVVSKLTNGTVADCQMTEVLLLINSSGAQRLEYVVQVYVGIAATVDVGSEYRVMTRTGIEKLGLRTSAPYWCQHLEQAHNQQPIT